MDNIREILNQIKSDDIYGVIIEETPDVDGLMYAVFSKQDGSIVTGHWICHNTPQEMIEQFIEILQNL